MHFSSNFRRNFFQNDPIRILLRTIFFFSSIITETKVNILEMLCKSSAQFFISLIYCWYRDSIVNFHPHNKDYAGRGLIKVYLISHYHLASMLSDFVIALTFLFLDNLLFCRENKEFHFDLSAKYGLDKVRILFSFDNIPFKAFVFSLTTCKTHFFLKTINFEQTYNEISAFFYKLRQN